MVQISSPWEFQEPLGPSKTLGTLGSQVTLSKIMDSSVGTSKIPTTTRLPQKESMYKA